MNKIELDNYNLEHTLLGGQAFNWDKINDSFYGFTQSTIIKLKPEKEHILWQTYPHLDNYEYLAKLLSLDDEYEEKLLLISEKDNHIKKAIDQYSGLRILNQDFEQTLLSFILSSHKSIKGVRKAIRDFSKKYGRIIKIDNIEFSLFPRLEDITTLTEDDFRNIGFGFRSSYFKEASVKLVNEELLIKSNDNEEEVRNYLIQFKGIGEKIADCIMVFSLEFNNITPLDIWGKRVLVEFYNVDPTLKYSEMRKWYSDYFGENTALAGQFLFEYIRNLKSKF